MTLSVITFLMFAMMALVSAAFILFTKNILYAAFALLLTLLSVAGLYVFAAAEFLAVTQIVIYVGGILVLILFGVFLTTRPVNSVIFQTEGMGAMKTVLLLFVLLSGLFWLVSKFDFESYPWARSVVLEPQSSHVRQIGTQLLTTNVVPFEIVAILLMAALMGAAFLASRAIKKEGGK